MAKVKANTSTRKIRPALTPEAREKQMISLATTSMQSAKWGVLSNSFAISNLMVN